MNDLEWVTLFKDILAYNNSELNQKTHWKDKLSIESYYFRTKKIVTDMLLKYFRKHANGKFVDKDIAYAFTS
jgi:hypothetical protein